MTKNATIYSDVPQLLVDLMNEIRFDKLSPQEGQQALQKLDDLLSKRKEITIRGVKSPTSTKTVAFKGSVPDEAINYVNRFDYTKVSTWMMKMAMPMIRTHLKKMGLL